MPCTVGGNECIILIGGKGLERLLPANDVLFTIIDLPHTMIETVGNKEHRITCAIIRIMDISVAIHLKPVDVFLLRYTNRIYHRRKNYNPLFQLVETELYIIINDAVITDTAFI